AHNHDPPLDEGLTFAVMHTAADGPVPPHAFPYQCHYDIRVTAFSDAMAAALQEIVGGVQVDDAGAAPCTSSTTGEKTVAITLTKPEAEGVVGEDYDGSERLTQFISDGAPDGMLVKGIQVGDGELLGTAVLVGPNKWVISLPEDDALDFGGPLTVNVVFEA